MKKPSVILAFLVIITVLWWLTDTGRMLLIEMSLSDTQEVIIEGEFAGYERTFRHLRSKRYWSAVVITPSGTEKIDMRGMIGYNTFTPELNFNVGDRVRFSTLSHENKLVAVSLLGHTPGDLILPE